MRVLFPHSAEASVPSEEPPAVSGLTAAEAEPSGALQLSAPPDSKRILVVDDHPFLRRSIISLLAHEPDLVCCGEADSVADTPGMVAQLAPDLVLLDIRLRDGDSYSLIPDLTGRFPQVPILVLSQACDLSSITRALNAGARGYVVKQESAHTLVDAIRIVLSGRVYVSSAYAKALS